MLVQKYIFSLWIFLTTVIIYVKCNSYVNRVKNGYERLVISIDEDVGQENCGLLLDYLQAVLSHTSQTLHHATKGQVHLEQISVLLPSSWNVTSCARGRRIITSTYHNREDADVKIGPEHPIYGKEPWTAQYGGCGTPGRYIYLPSSFLVPSTTTGSPDIPVKARYMVREWAKFRYGVFDETGYYQDALYPYKYTEGGEVGGNSKDDLKLNACSKKINNGGKNCTSGDCNTFINASVMSSSLLNNASEFCDNATHVHTAPTKHNFLCSGRSVWEVISKNKDFVEKWQDSSSEETTGDGLFDPTVGNTPSPRFDKIDSSISIFPTIDFVLPKTQTYVLLLDRTKVMNENGRWTSLRRGLLHLIHLLPTGSELAIVAFANSSTVHLPVTTVTDVNRDGLFGRVPLRPLRTQDKACFTCGLKTASKVMNRNSDQSSAATVIILTSGSHNTFVKMKDFERAVRNVRNHAQKIHVISFGSGSEPELQRLATYGSYHVIPEPSSRPLLPQMHLITLFLGIINKVSSTNMFKIHEAEEHPLIDQSSHVQGTFVMEESLGHNTMVTLHAFDPADVEGLQLISPSGRKHDLPSFAEGMHFFKINGISEPGVWSYVVKFSHPVRSHSVPVAVDVKTQSRHKEAITIDAWNEIRYGSLRGNYHLVAIHAQLHQGLLPVLNASVQATVTSLDQGGQLITTEIQLIDDGSAEPDLMKGDGIYSGYFPFIGMKPGFYSVVVEATDAKGGALVPYDIQQYKGSCCGRAIQYKSSVPTSPFTRFVVAPSFYIEQGIPSHWDPYPPGRISDLTVESLIEGSNEVTLSWTAPGDNLDKGKAIRYEMRCSTSRDVLLSAESFHNQGILVHPSLLPEPLERGTRQNCTVGVPWTNQVFFYALIAFDTSTNRGQVSNLAAVYMKEIPRAFSGIYGLDPTVNSSIIDGVYSDGNSTSLLEAGRAWFQGLNELELYAITGGAAGLLLLIITFILIPILARRNKSTNNAKNKKNSECPIYQIYVKNAYIKEEDKKIKIMTQDGRIISSGGNKKKRLLWFWNCANNQDNSNHVAVEDKSVTTNRHRSEEIHRNTSVYTPNITVNNELNEEATAMLQAQNNASQLSPNYRPQISRDSGSGTGETSSVGSKPSDETESVPITDCGIENQYVGMYGHNRPYYHPGNTDTYGVVQDNLHSGYVMNHSQQRQTDMYQGTPVPFIHNQSYYGYNHNEPQTVQQYNDLNEAQNTDISYMEETVPCNEVTNIEEEDDGGFKERSHSFRKATIYGTKAPPPPPPYDCVNGNSSSGYGSNSSIHCAKKKRHISFV